MVTTRRGDKRNNLHPPTNIFKTLIFAFESPQGFKSRLLRSSYYALIQISSNQQVCSGKGADLNELVLKTKEGEVGVTLRDLCRLSDILFEELQKRLKQLHFSKHDASGSPSLELEVVNLVIRCCMVILTLPLPQKHLLERGRVLLLIIKKLCLLENVNINKLGSCQCMYSGEESSYSFAKVASLSSLELFDPCIPFTAAILEVLIDELLVHDRLRKYLQLIGSLSPPEERLFKHDSSYGQLGMMMEMFSSHFSLSIPDENALCRFLNGITWVPAKNLNASELSVIAARTLLQNPAVTSSPKLMQAHIVSLVSDAISVNVDREPPTPDPGLIDSYLSIFESSVILYTQHMSSLKTEKHPGEGRGSFVISHNETFQPSFYSSVNPTKRQKLDRLIGTLSESWNSNQRSLFYKTKGDLLTFSTEYIHESRHVLDVACRDEVLSFLSGVLFRVANEANDIELPLNRDASLQDICLLASLLMVMSNSLIQALWCLRHCPETNRYGFIVGIVSCFGEFRLRLPIQKLTETHPMKDKESGLMLLHFLGLLSLSFDSGLDFLVKGCVSTIMALTNLFVFEEGNIDALMSLADSGPQQSIAVYREAVVYQCSSAGVASQFQKLRTLYVSNDVGEERSLSVETCSGEIYLKARLQGSGDDDLADFVECKKGKDYDAWLKARGKFREWKFAKRRNRRWEKKKQTCRSMLTNT